MSGGSGGPGTCAENGQRIGTRCSLISGTLLLCYALFDTYLFYKFTPVYRPTHCGQQTAELQHLELGSPIRVSLKIQVVCENPNSYAVEIRSSKPGKVFAGAHREWNLGTLRLVEGSTLPESGNGLISVRMDTELAAEDSKGLVGRLLSSGRLPLFIELRFDVRVDVSFGLASFGTTAPFVKQCGLELSGMLSNTKHRLGAFICKESIQEVAHALEHSADAAYESMSFTAGQMDPDRVRMGENLKNVSIIGAGGFCYLMAFFLLSSWFRGWKAAFDRAAAEAATTRNSYSRIEKDNGIQGFARWLGLSPNLPPPPPPASPSGLSSTLLTNLGFADTKKAQIAPEEESTPLPKNFVSFWGHLGSAMSPRSNRGGSPTAASPKSVASSIWGDISPTAMSNRPPSETSQSSRVQSSNCAFGPVARFLQCGNRSRALRPEAAAAPVPPGSPWSSPSRRR